MKNYDLSSKYGFSFERLENAAQARNGEVAMTIHWLDPLDAPLEPVVINLGIQIEKRDWNEGLNWPKEMKAITSLLSGVFHIGALLKKVEYFNPEVERLHVLEHFSKPPFPMDGFQFSLQKTLGTKHKIVLCFPTDLGEELVVESGVSIAFNEWNEQKRLPNEPQALAELKAVYTVFEKVFRAIRKKNRLFTAREFYQVWGTIFPNSKS